MTYALPPPATIGLACLDIESKEMEKAGGESQDFVTFLFLTEKGRELLESFDFVPYGTMLMA